MTEGLYYDEPEDQCTWCDVPLPEGTFGVNSFCSESCSVAWDENAAVAQWYAREGGVH